MLGFYVWLIFTDRGLRNFSGAGRRLRTLMLRTSTKVENAIAK
jgi:hypothetical protein